jgi:hypothetical protein
MWRAVELALVVDQLPDGVNRGALGAPSCHQQLGAFEPRHSGVGHHDPDVGGVGGIYAIGICVVTIASR